MYFVFLNMKSVYHVVAIHVSETSWAHVWRLRSCYLRTGYDMTQPQNLARDTPGLPGATPRGFQYRDYRYPDSQHHQKYPSPEASHPKGKAPPPTTVTR
jgi:hypothetical protein